MASLSEETVLLTTSMSPHKENKEEERNVSLQIHRPFQLLLSDAAL